MSYGSAEQIAVISLVHRNTIGVHVISSWQKSHNGFLVQEMRVIMVRKARWKFLKHPPLPTEDSKSESVPSPMWNVRD